MSWSLVLLALCEGARDDVLGALKRAERLAEKAREKEGESLEDLETPGVSKASQEEMMETAFKKLWKTNSSWAQQALLDAVSFARENEPRCRSTIDPAEKKDEEVSKVFYGSLWPSLSGRGWKEVSTAEGKTYAFDKYKVRSTPFFLICYHSISQIVF